MALQELTTRTSRFMKMLSGGIAIQVITSGSNFVIGLLLIRRTSNAEYGYYVLIGTALMLATTIQFTFIQPPMLIRLTRSDLAARANLVGSLYRDQQRLVPLLLIPAVVLALSLGVAGQLTVNLALILAGGTVAIMGALNREFFRLVLFAYRVSRPVLRADAVYCLMLVSGIALATITPWPAAVAALAMAVAAYTSRLLLSRALWRHEPWNRKAPHGALREMFHQGSFSAFGGGVHFLFSQGYTYLVAAVMNVSAVATLAATRLPVSPVGLLSNGIGTLMLPTVSRWSHDHDAATVLRRITLFACGLAMAMSGYLVVMWLARDWIFAQVLRKSFDQRDVLLVLWSVIALLTAFRDQFTYFLTARGRFQITSSVTFVSAIVALSTTFFAIRAFGVVGAPVGVLTGEIVNLAGFIVFSLREARLHPRASY